LFNVLPHFPKQKNMFGYLQIRLHSILIHTKPNKVKMQEKIKLKNSDEVVLLDSQVFEKLKSDPQTKGINLLGNLRKHSSGCAVYQKTYKNSDGSFRTETIYLHRYIAEKYKSGFSEENNLVGALNGNKLDCRLENLVWRSRATASRQRKTSSKTGYTGVYQENRKYRAIISINGKAVHLGMYNNPEDAAEAYNQKSVELYGEKAKINAISASPSATV
jgi:hypothetical protein